MGEVSNTTYLTIVQDSSMKRLIRYVFIWEIEYNNTYIHTHFVLLFSTYIIFNTEREKSYE